MLKIISTISFLLVINTCLISQVSIDYSPKSLHAELKKAAEVNVELTEIIPSPELARTIHFGKFFSVAAPSNFSLVKYVYVGRVNTCRAGGCNVRPGIKTSADSEFFDYYILYDSTASIQLVKIFNYQASHGQEVTSSSWLKQFKNYDGKEELIAGKNIDAISGATISVDATTFDVELRTNMLKKIIQQYTNK